MSETLNPGYCPGLVISIHGIRTAGAWQKVFSAVMSGLPCRTESYDYGRYGLIRFLTPPFNRRLVDQFYDWFGQIVAGCAAVDLCKYDRRPSIVAHSLGSWIVGNAMLKHEDVRLDKLILAGSILPRDFDWATLFARDQVACVRNECGHRDPWPRWAGRLVAQTGTGGSEGFEWFGTSIENVPCEWFGHSDGLLRQHMKSHWIPVLLRQPFPLALLHGRNIESPERFSQILDYAGTVIDQEAYGKLSHYVDTALPRSLSRTWIRINADIYTFLVDRQTEQIAGYINAMPINDVTYKGIRTGRVLDREVRPNDVMPYVGSETAKVYLMSIAVNEIHRQWGDGCMQNALILLLTGFIDKLIWYAKVHRVRVTHLLATAWTPEGERICRVFSMTEVGRDRFGDAIFELNLDKFPIPLRRKALPVLRRLLGVYDELRRSLG